MSEEWLPQQVFIVLDNIEFCSRFDSGNLCRVESRGKNAYNCYAYRESADSRQCSWFYFSITTTAERRITLNVRNLNNQSRLYGEGGHRSVYKNASEWRPIPAHEWLGCAKADDGLYIRFRHKLLRGTTYFAFSHPYSYEETQKSIEELEACFPAVVTRDLLCHSALGRRVDVITVGNEPLKGKPVVLASARVHPGETPGQFMLFGMLWYLLSDCPRAKTLRNTIAFKFVPMLNPDGVYLGKYRTNSTGHNLNRFYFNPQEVHEAVGALKALAATLPLVAYVDFHGHANKRGAFCYGNSFPTNVLRDCHEFMKNIAKCSSYFDASRCNFNPPNITVKDKGCARDNETTEGSSRVQLHYANPQLIHSYTLEAHYATDLRQRPMNPAAWKEIGAAVAQAVFHMDFPNRTPCRAV